MVLTVNFKILKNIIVIGLFLLISKASGLLKELVIAYKYGIGAITDSFSFLFTMYSWPLGLIMSVFSVVMVPLFIKAKSCGGDEFSEFIREMFSGAILLAFTISVGYVAFFNYIGSDLNNNENINIITAELFPYFSVYQFFGVLSAFFSVLMISNNRHINSLLESFVPIGIALFALLGSVYFYMTLGLLVGGGAQFVLLYLIYSYHHGYLIPSVSFKSIYWGEFKKGASIILIGQFLLSFTTVIDQLIAASYDEGTLSSVAYSTRVSGIFMTLIALSFTRAALPIFSEHVLSGPIKETRSVVYKWATILFSFGVLVSSLCNYFSVEIVQLVYQRGAFQESDTKKVSDFFSIASLMFPFYFSSLVFVAYRNSLKNYYIIMFSGIIGFLAKLIFYISFSEVLDVEVILYSTVAMYAVSLVFFVLIQIFNE